MRGCGHRGPPLLGGTDTPFVDPIFLHREVPGAAGTVLPGEERRSDARSRRVSRAVYRCDADPSTTKFATSCRGVSLLTPRARGGYTRRGRLRRRLRSRG